MIEHVEFLKIIKLLEDNYNRKLPDNIIRIWYDELKNYDSKNLKKAIIESIKEYQFFPTTNQIKKILTNVPTKGFTPNEIITFDNGTKGYFDEEGKIHYT